MLRHDQAEGLRRLLTRPGRRVVAFVGAPPDAGRSSAVLNLATALAHRGQEVMVLDGHGPNDGLWKALGVQRRFSRAEAAARARAPKDAPVRGPAGIALVAPAGAVPAVAPDTVLFFPASPWPPESLSEELSSADVVVVMSARRASLTAAYAAVKRLSATCGTRHVRILVNRAASEAQARSLVRNLARVAREFLAVSLDLLGWVPYDAQLEQAARLRLPVVDAFPGAEAARAYCEMAERIARWPQGDNQSEDFTRLMRRLLEAPRVAAAAR